MYEDDFPIPEPEDDAQADILKKIQNFLDLNFKYKMLARHMHFNIIYYSESKKIQVPPESVWFVTVITEITLISRCIDICNMLQVPN